MDFTAPPPSTPIKGMVNKRQTKEVRGQFLIPDEQLSAFHHAGTGVTAARKISLQSELPRTVTLPWELLGFYAEVQFSGVTPEGGAALAEFVGAAALSARLKILRNGVPIFIAGQTTSMPVHGWILGEPPSLGHVFVFSEDFVNPIQIGPRDQLALLMEIESQWSQEAPVYIPWGEGIWTPGQAVTSGGKYYVCIKETEANGNKPPEAAHWEEIKTPFITFNTVFTELTQGTMRYLINDPGK